MILGQLKITMGKLLSTDREIRNMYGILVGILESCILAYQDGRTVLKWVGNSLWYGMDRHGSS